MTDLPVCVAYDIEIIKNYFWKNKRNNHHYKI